MPGQRRGVLGLRRVEADEHIVALAQHLHGPEAIDVMDVVEVTFAEPEQDGAIHLVFPPT